MTQFQRLMMTASVRPKAGQSRARSIKGADHGHIVLPRYVPLVVGLSWILGTYGLFWLVGSTHAVPDGFKLTGFVIAALLMFSLGYWLKARTYPRDAQSKDIEERTPELAKINRWILVSSLFTILSSFVLLSAYGGTSLREVWNGILHPGESYYDRLAFNRQQLLGEPNIALRLLTLFTALSTPLIPFSILYWRRMSVKLRIFAGIGTLMFCVFWMYIGTLKGLGDAAVFALSAVLVLMTMHTEDAKIKFRLRRLMGAGIVILTFVGYLVYNQADRVVARQIEGFEPNSTVSSIIGPRLASGVAVAAFYPTHGYLGLAYNLEIDGWEWTRMRGASPAMDAYLSQYVSSPSVFSSTYPARTQALYGWPARNYWATIFPWLASDLSFAGAILAMAVVGWWLARFWYETIVLRSRLSLLMFCQLMLLVIYIPANNQLGTSRSAMISFASLLMLYVLKRSMHNASRPLLEKAQMTRPSAPPRSHHGRSS